MQNSTQTNVIDLHERRHRTVEQRRLRNDQFAQVILSRWSEKGPTCGRTLFTAIVRKAVEGPIATPDRAAILLPVLLEVLDEMEARDDAKS